jgi:hypothetical protein
MENLDKSPKMPSEIMEEIIASFKIPENKQVLEYSSFLLLQVQCCFFVTLPTIHFQLSNSVLLYIYTIIISLSNNEEKK